MHGHQYQHDGQICEAKHLGQVVLALGFSQ